MSFFTHHSRHSWPPYETLARNPRSRTDRKSEDLSIDENPFSYFISPPADDAQELQEDYFSAGIDNAPDSTPLHRGPTGESPVTHAPKSPGAILRRWIKYMETHHPYIYHRHQEEGPPPEPVVPFISPPNRPSPIATHSPRLPKPVENNLSSNTSSERGREADRIAEDIRGRKQARSRSGRPRSWREPSADLWPVSEAGEGDEETAPVRISHEKRLDSPPGREGRIKFIEEIV